MLLASVPGREVSVHWEGSLFGFGLVETDWEGFFFGLTILLGYLRGFSVSWSVGVGDRVVSGLSLPGEGLGEMVSLDLFELVGRQHQLVRW